MEMADGAAFEAPGAPFEFRIAFEKATAKEILTRVDGDKLGSESHHTPPKMGSARSGNFAAPESWGCLQETGAVLAGS